MTLLESLVTGDFRETDHLWVDLTTSNCDRHGPEVPFAVGTALGDLYACLTCALEEIDRRYGGKTAKSRRRARSATSFATLAARRCRLGIKGPNDDGIEAHP
jgi:hypothetical protein